MYINYDYFCCFQIFSVLLCSFYLESDAEAEFIDLIEYTAKICNKADSLSGIIQHKNNDSSNEGFSQIENANISSSNFKEELIIPNIKTFYSKCVITFKEYYVS